MIKLECEGLWEKEGELVLGVECRLARACCGLKTEGLPPAAPAAACFRPLRCSAVSLRATSHSFSPVSMLVLARPRSVSLLLVRRVLCPTLNNPSPRRPRSGDLHCESSQAAPSTAAIAAVLAALALSQNVAEINDAF